MPYICKFCSGTATKPYQAFPTAILLSQPAPKQHRDSACTLTSLLASTYSCNPTKLKHYANNKKLNSSPIL